MTPEELQATGERVSTQEGLQHPRGLDQSADDWLPAACCRTHPSGPGKGVHVTEDELRMMIDDYYQARGWTPDGLIPKAKLIELGLEDIAEDVGVEDGPEAIPTGVEAAASEEAK
jgi:aldehyde:ferredoxin oxidoreductase